MMKGPSYFEIQADDVGRAEKFYSTIFGWKLQRDPSLPIEYSRIETGGAMGGILKRPAAAPPERSGTNAFTCSMEVENFDTVADKILKNGGIVAMPKFAIPGKCWQEYFLDTEKNVFGIFQVDPKAA
jgi:predicted enzyme related to lactoylglutathione lyase